MTTDHLCQKCASFNIRELYELAVSRVRKSKPAKSTVGGFSTYEGFPNFYKHHHNLQSLSASAENGCMLCASIWQQCAKLLPVDLHARKVLLPEGEFDQQILLGLSSWSPEADGMPYLTAVQQSLKGPITNLATFDVFVKPGCAAVGFETMPARTVQTDPSSEICLEVAQTWYYDCLESHPTCSRMLSQKHPLPTRVIDVGDASHNPRLTISDGQLGLWAALSYCWGGYSSFTLNKDTSDELLEGIVPLLEFPKTLQDAIIITRSLGLKFLWIDALCIMQDSADDWALEASRMKDVYGGASITIAGSNSVSTNDGIFKDRSMSPELCRLEWRASPSIEKHDVFLRPGSEFWDTTMKNEHLNSRGWTLQESLLAPRTLSYGTQQMIWECLECKIGESGRPVLPGQRHRDKKFVQTILANDFSAWEKVQQTVTRLSLKTLPLDWSVMPASWELHHDAMYSRWFDIVTDYTGRNLTMRSDILPALGGISRSFHNLLRDQYCAGLWKHDLVRGMCWQRSAKRNRNFRAVRTGQKEPEDHLPSWSWASIVGGRVMNTLEDEQRWPFTKVEETAHLLRAQIIPRNHDQFGQITHAELTIKAPFQAIHNPTTDAWKSEYTARPVLMERVLQEVRFSTSREEFEQQHKSHRGQRFAVVRLMRTSQLWKSTVKGKDYYLPRAEILMLESTEGADKWRRVGFFSVSIPMDPDINDYEVLLFDEMKTAKWEWKEVTIV